MQDIPYSFGFAPELWKQMTDVEILKKAGVFNGAKMRTILLMNPELNMNNKQLGRDMMRHAKHLKVLPRKQYGSRKHICAIIVALNKHLTMDLLRQQRQAGTLCANKAKSCYDCTVHNMTMLSMQRVGAPKNPILSVYSALQDASHKVRTA
jgi:hypothetical protein